eukprot:Pompholyxophrys_punicea_v1_NODE_685_length_1457_cov_2.201854.p1 type:complete len:101 gc:universal NODE_685_length_1457_cov_2.201854:1196-894(-)
MIFDFKSPIHPGLPCWPEKPLKIKITRNSIFCFNLCLASAWFRRRRTQEISSAEETFSVLFCGISANKKQKKSIPCFTIFFGSNSFQMQENLGLSERNKT